MDLHRRTRAAALCAAMSTALVVGMAGTAVAFAEPEPPVTALVVPDRVETETPPDGPVTTPAVTARTPAP